MQVPSVGIVFKGSFKFFAGKKVVCATVGVGGRLPIDRTMSHLDKGVEPHGRIPASAVCPWGVHLMDVQSERTTGTIDGIV